MTPSAADGGVAKMTLVTVKAFALERLILAFSVNTIRIRYAHVALGSGKSGMANAHARHCALSVDAALGTGRYKREYKYLSARGLIKAYVCRKRVPPSHLHKYIGKHPRNAHFHNREI